MFKREICMSSTEKDYAESHGVKRGSCDGKLDAHPKLGWKPHIDLCAKDEGLLPFTQTGSCRRQILTQVYKNQQPISLEGIGCCDICDPGLLDSIRPGHFKAPPCQTAITKGILHKPTQLALNEWRISIYKTHHSDDQWTFEAILGKDLIELLASVGPIESFQRLEKILGVQWGWWNQYGQNLWETIEKLEMPELVPLPKGTKRKESERVEAGASQPKRGRVGASGGCGQRSEAMPALPALTSIQQASHVHGNAQPHVPYLPATQHLPSPVAAPVTPANPNRNHQHPPQPIASTGHSSFMSGYPSHPAASYPSPIRTPNNHYPHYPNYPNLPSIPISHYGNQLPLYSSSSSSPFQTSPGHSNPYTFLPHPGQSPFPLVLQPFPHPGSNPPTSQTQHNDLTRLNLGNYSQESQFFESSPDFGWRRQ